MKKLILPLLLLVAFGMLAAVESAPSEVVGYVKYDCVAGLNMVAVAMDQGYAWASDLGNDYVGLTDAISYFDPTLQDWTTAVDLGGFWDGDFEIGNGSALLMYAYSPFSYYSIGEMYAPATFNLIAGLNGVMIPLNRSDIAWAGEAGTEMGSDAVSFFDSSIQDWSTAVDLGGFWDGDFEVSIGSPFLAYVYGPTTWPTRGRVVTPRSSK